jgi:hypothetical protein
MAMGAIAAGAAGALVGSGLVAIFATRTVGGVDLNRLAAGGAIAMTTGSTPSARRPAPPGAGRAPAMM